MSSEQVELPELPHWSAFDMIENLQGIGGAPLEWFPLAFDERSRQLREARTTLRDKEVELAQANEDCEVWRKAGVKQQDRAERAEAALAAANAKCEARIAELKRECASLLEGERKVSHELRTERDAAREETFKQAIATCDAIADEVPRGKLSSVAMICGERILRLSRTPAPPSVPAKESDADTTQVSQ